MSDNCDGIARPIRGYIKIAPRRSIVMILSPGSLIDSKYEVISTIGVGGFGIVYKARQLAFDRIVALKLLHNTEELDADALARFEREAKILADLRHKNLAMFYGYGFFNGAPYMVLEYLDGQSLQSDIDKGPISAGRSVDIAQALCSALSAVHACGVVHRDLKPSNIVMCRTPDGQIPKLIDFGLAWVNPYVGEERQRLTEVGAVVGSPHYMSPEQCLGELPDERSDVYAVGCVLFACIVGGPVFVADETLAIMQMHVDRVAPTLQSAGVDAAVVAELQPILDIALTKDRTARYQSADEMLSALDSVQRASFPAVSIVSGRAAQPAFAPLPVVRRLPWFALPTLTVFVLVTVAGLLFTQTNATPKTESSVHYFGIARQLSKQHADSTIAMMNYKMALELNKTDFLLASSQVDAACAEIGDIFQSQGKFQESNDVLGPRVREMLQAKRGNAMFDGMVRMQTHNLVALHRENDALELFQECDTLLKKKGYSLTAPWRCQYASIWLALNKPQKALDQLSRVHPEGIDDNSTLSVYFDLLAKAHKAMGHDTAAAAAMSERQRIRVTREAFARPDLESFRKQRHGFSN